MDMIGLMDCNNFFVSCERLFRPDLQHKPVAVLSSNDGCIIARSQEVKDMGIQMGAPLFQVRDLCTKQGVTLFSSNFTLYRDISARVMKALQDEFEKCEVYSIDEAFFSIKNSSDVEYLRKVRANIMQKTGIPVSIGVASTKTLAKLASKIAKSGEGVYFLQKEDLARISKDTSCGSVWGIGRQITSFLTQNGINSVADFIALDHEYVRKNLGIHGERLQLELSGISVHALDNSFSPHESHTSTRSFPTHIHDKTVLQSALAYHVTRVAEKLRENGQIAGKLTIIVKGSRFGDYAYKKGVAMCILPCKTDSTKVLLQQALKLFEVLYDSSIPYKKAGVVVSSLEEKTWSTSSLFFEGDSNDSLGELQDILNQKFGRDTVKFGTLLGEKKWQERRQLKSPEYTTNWSHIPRVKAI